MKIKILLLLSFLIFKNYFSQYEYFLKEDTTFFGLTSFNTETQKIGQLFLSKQDSSFQLMLFEDLPTDPLIGKFTIKDREIQLFCYSNCDVSHINNHPIVFIENPEKTLDTLLQVYSNEGMVLNNYSANFKIQYDSIKNINIRTVQLWKDNNLIKSFVLKNQNVTQIKILIPFDFKQIVPNGDEIIFTIIDNNTLEINEFTFTRMILNSTVNSKKKSSRPNQSKTK